MQIDLTVFSSLLGMGSIIVGVIATLHSIRRFTRARKLGIFLEFHKTLYDLDFIKDLNQIQLWEWNSAEEFFSKYGPEVNLDAFARFTRVGSYFDGLSRLVQKKFIDDTFIPETTAIALISFWEKFEPTADEMAVVYNRPRCWDAMKGMYERLQRQDN